MRWCGLRTEGQTGCRKEPKEAPDQRWCLYLWRMSEQQWLNTMPTSVPEKEEEEPCIKANSFIQDIFIAFSVSGSEVKNL